MKTNLLIQFLQKILVLTIPIFMAIIILGAVGGFLQQLFGYLFDDGRPVDALEIVVFAILIISLLGVWGLFRALSNKGGLVTLLLLIVGSVVYGFVVFGFGPESIDLWIRKGRTYFSYYLFHILLYMPLAFSIYQIVTIANKSLQRTSR